MTDLLMAASSAGKLDLVLEAGDLALDESLRTPALVSLFTDALALAEDELPDAGTDRRGWWAEALLVGEGEETWGARLWLLERSTITNRRLADAEVYGREALRWLLDRQIAERVDVTASRLDTTRILLEVSLVRGDAPARAELWEATERLELVLGPTRFSLLAIP
jgi:phage gp46-like protein